MATFAGIVAGFLTVLAPFAAAASASDQRHQEPGLLQALRQGGFVLVMRHAHSPTTPPAPHDADPGNRNGERQLDQVGRASALKMGQAIKYLGIPIGDVWTSPTYRARETARIANLPNATIAPELGDYGRSMQAATAIQGTWLRRQADRPPRAGTNTVIVTQFPNIAAAFGKAAIALGDGGTLVFQPRSAQPPRLVGRIQVAQWPRLRR